MRKLICAGNWKLNKTPVETSQFLDELVRQVPEERQKNYVVFPSTVCLAAAAVSLGDSKIGWGAQNCYLEHQGAYTGETSSLTVAGMGASHMLIGHSERRTLFGETDEEVCNKVKDVQALNLVPIICVGESLAQREAGSTNSIISDQLRRSLVKADTSKEFIIAYEPVWAIGTGKVATPDQADEAHYVLRSVLSELLGEEAANRVSILYGGSVKPGNAAELSEKEHIDGFLIGGASLDIESFVSIGNLLL